MNRRLLLPVALGALLIPFPSVAEEAVRIEGGSLPANPRRIVSINPCLDALLLRLADPDRIVAISHYSRDPQSSSIPPAQSLRFATTSGSAEEVLALRPDVVVGSAHVALPTVVALARLGVPLVRFSTPSSISESLIQIAAFARLVGRPERGAALIRATDKALRDARPSDDPKIPALIVTEGGLVPGSHTIANELLGQTGFLNQGARYGPRKWDVVSLEQIIGQPPNVLFVGSPGPRSRNRILTHPVLAEVARHLTIVDFPSRLVHCAGPTLIEASSALAAARQRHAWRKGAAR